MEESSDVVAAPGSDSVAFYLNSPTPLYMSQSLCMEMGYERWEFIVTGNYCHIDWNMHKYRLHSDIKQSKMSVTSYFPGLLSHLLIINGRHESQPTLLLVTSVDAHGSPVFARSSDGPGASGDAEDHLPNPK